ncbi:MAG: hypothetical protein KGH64_01235 [Candidatus Micrarchaeota archaeon]|nr:hypothetical protein [Candidatus Micrarchaeota archaeon]MDE1833941.1 hypothetical protein [Candidatus Micrarchaeota archaeon]MDE1859658.1 hypothetical protein [Candidatus Micrarchaeota archaeon]
MSGTFQISKIELKKMLSNFKINEKNIDTLVSQIDRSYKHINAIAFAEQLQKFGLQQNDIANIFRRIGIDDITISKLFDVIEENKIKSSFGKLIELSVD